MPLTLALLIPTFPLSHLLLPCGSLPSSQGRFAQWQWCALMLPVCVSCRAIYPVYWFNAIWVQLISKIYNNYNVCYLLLFKAEVSSMPFMVEHGLVLLNQCRTYDQLGPLRHCECQIHVDYRWDVCWLERHRTMSVIVRGSPGEGIHVSRPMMAKHQCKHANIHAEAPPIIIPILLFIFQPLHIFRGFSDWPVICRFRVSS